MFIFNYDEEFFFCFNKLFSIYLQTKKLSSTLEELIFQQCYLQTIYNVNFYFLILIYFPTTQQFFKFLENIK